MENQTSKERKGTDQREGNIGQQPTNPTGTSGRDDADLQREGNLGNERNKSERRDEEEPGMGNRPAQKPPAQKP